MNPDQEPPPSEEAACPWLEGPLSVAPADETDEQYLERVAEMMGRLARDENLRLFFAKRLS